MKFFEKNAQMIRDKMVENETLNSSITTADDELLNIDDHDLEKLDIHTLKKIQKLDQMNRKDISKLSKEERQMVEAEDEKVDLLDQEELKIIGFEPTEIPSELTEALFNRLQQPDDNLSIADVIK